MNRTIVIALFLAIVNFSFSATASPAAKPNVVLIVADDLGYMDIGINNPQSFYETTRIDGLARSGVRFTNGYAACPVCSPTRASIMTGKYPPRTGITDWIGGTRAGKLLPAPNRESLSLDEVTIAKRLRNSGYATFFAGKWHLGTGDFSPNGHGFGPDLVGSGQFYYPPSKLPAPDADDDPKTTDRIADAAIEFMERHREEPFFAYLPFLAVHTPIRAKKSLVEKYEAKKRSAPLDSWGREGERQVRLVQNHPEYAAMVEQMDQAVGRVLDALDRNRISDRTIVIFTSDNGGLSTSEGHPTSNVPLRAGKGWMYEGGIRTPWFIRTRDGISLVPVMKGGTIAPRSLFWHYPHYGNQGGAPGGCVRRGEWKLMEWYEDGRRELFHLGNDIGETTNLAESNPDRVRELAAQLAEWRNSVSAIMPTANPDYKGK